MDKKILNALETLRKTANTFYYDHDGLTLTNLQNINYYLMEVEKCLLKADMKYDKKKRLAEA